MTTILAVQHKGGFVIAADSQVTEEERPYFSTKVKKIAELDDYVLAGAGNSRYVDIVLFGWEPPRYDGSNIYNFMVTKFIPELRKIHEETGYTLKDDESFGFVVGLDNKLFYIAGDYSVLMEDKGIYGLGTGSSYAIGAVAGGATIEKALEVAKQFDINTGGKVQIVKRGTNA